MTVLHQQKVASALSHAPCASSHGLFMSEQLIQDLGGKGSQVGTVGISKCHFSLTQQAPLEQERPSSGLEKAPPSTSAGERSSAREGMAHYLLKKYSFS